MEQTKKWRKKKYNISRKKLNRCWGEESRFNKPHVKIFINNYEQNIFHLPNINCFSRNFVWKTNTKLHKVENFATKRPNYNVCSPPFEMKLVRMQTNWHKFHQNGFKKWQFNQSSITFLYSVKTETKITTTISDWTYKNIKILPCFTKSKFLGR